MTLHFQLCGNKNATLKCSERRSIFLVVYNDKHIISKVFNEL